MRKTCSAFRILLSKAGFCFNQPQSLHSLSTRRERLNGADASNIVQAADASYRSGSDAAKPNDQRTGFGSPLVSGIIWEVDYNRRRGDPRHHPTKWLRIRRVDFFACGTKAGTWMKSPAAARAALLPRTPHRTRKNIGDRLLLAVMVDARPLAGFDLKQAAPRGRFEAQLWRDCRQTLRAGRPRGARIEANRTENPRRIFGHGDLTPARSHALGPAPRRK
jgi:hypothetical protein